MAWIRRTFQARGQCFMFFSHLKDCAFWRARRGEYRYAYEIREAAEEEKLLRALTLLAARPSISRIILI